MELMEAIATRKSTRGYKAEQITDEALNAILNAGSAAPIGMGAYNTVHLTVIQKAELLDKITEAAGKLYNNPNMKPFYGAPTLIIVSGKPNEKAPGIEMANTGCVMENMALAATDLGLGNVYLLAFAAALLADKDLLKELKLPDGFVPCAGLAVGYSTEPLDSKKASKHVIEVNTIK